MPAVRSEAEVLAIFLADIHLSLKAPLWRSAEPDWLEAQYRPLEEVRTLQNKHKCPIICAGDTVNKWNCSPELINYALNYLPEMYAIPGQHGLPNHQYADIHRSAYWTLVQAGKIKNLEPEGVTIVGLMSGQRLILSAFPPGYEIKPVSGCKDDKDEGDIWVAVVHDYLWIPGHSYPNAPADNQLTRKVKQLEGYDVAVYGDNHKGFSGVGSNAYKVEVFNCGTLMRRKSDEIDYKPQIGLLLESGKVVPYYLDTSKDKHLDSVDMALKTEQSNLEMTEFMNELGKLGKTALDFKDAMKEFLHSGGASPEAKHIILRAMEKE